MLIFNRMMPTIMRSPDEGGGAGGGTPSAGTPPAAGGTPPAAGAPPAAQPAFAPWGDGKSVYTVGEGDKAQPWWNAVPEQGARELLNAKQYKNPAELALAYYNANKLINEAGDKIAIPGEGATPEQVKAFRAKIGVPESPDKYEFKLPDGAQANPALMDFGKKMFHEMGVPAKDAQKGIDLWEGFVKEQQAAEIEADRVANEQAISKLETSWGADLEVNRAAGVRAMKALGLSEQSVAAIEANIGAAPIVELLALLGKKGGEGSGTTGGGAGSGDPNDPTTMTPAQATARIAQLRGDTAFNAKLNDKNHPDHTSAVQQLERLYARESSKT